MIVIFRNSLVFLLLSLFLCFSSCHKVSNDELWRNKVEFDDGTHIFVYHVNTCTKPKPIFTPTEKIIDFCKSKYDVYCYCISDEMAEVLNTISRKNINNFIDNSWIDVEDSDDLDRCLARQKLFDCTERTYYVDSGLKDGLLIPLSKRFYSF